MKVSTAEAKNRLPALIRAAEQGELIVITRHGKPVAQLGPAGDEARRVQLGTMRGKITFNPGWDAPMTAEELLGGDR